MGKSCNHPLFTQPSPLSRGLSIDAGKKMVLTEDESLGLTLDNVEKIV